MTARRRIILPDVSSSSGEVPVEGENLRYLRDVLRTKTGAVVEVLDGRGNVFEGVVESVGRRSLSVRIEGRVVRETESPLTLYLIQPLLKGEKMDLVVQKTTELGVKGIFPVITANSVVKKTRRLEHWRKVAGEAVRQSGRTVIPLIPGILSLEEVLEGLPSEAIKIVFHRDGKGKLNEIAGTVKGKQLPVYCLTGPEGGLSDDEVRAAVSAGFRPVSLGKRILRAETASLAAVTLIQFLLGDL